MISKKDGKILRKMLDMATEPDEPLTYDELLGFLFGIAITPDMIMPSEWLPIVFGEEMITVDSEKEAQRYINTLMRVANDLVEQFQEGCLLFPFDLDNLDHEDDLIPIQAWVVGFEEALSLRSECWYEEDLPETITEDQEELMTSLSVIEGIANPLEASALFEAKFENDDQSTQLIASLFVILPAAIDSIMAHASMLEEKRQQHLLAHSPGPPQIRAAPKIGRNAPCPCGSGKKYKKCCLLGEKIVPIR